MLGACLAWKLGQFTQLIALKPTGQGCFVLGVRVPGVIVIPFRQLVSQRKQIITTFDQDEKITTDNAS